jgi:hypothetical protein
MDIFERHKVAQGGVPHLMEVLWGAYRDSIRDHFVETGVALDDVAIDAKMGRAPATHFLKFCCDYLAQHRVVEHSMVDANTCFRLANNVLAILAPAVDEGGTMQDAGAIVVTDGKSAPGLQGIGRGPGAIGI